MIHNLNKAFENRIRLGLMSILLVDPNVDFQTVKARLNITDGNLSSHANALELKGYITINKQFIGKKSKTTYAITDAGKKAFKLHLDALENLLKGNN